MDAFKSYLFARNTYMLAMRTKGMTNAQIARRVGLTAVGVQNAIGKQPIEITKKSIKIGAKKAAKTRAIHNLERAAARKALELETIKQKLAETQMVADMKTAALAKAKSHKLIKGRL